MKIERLMNDRKHLPFIDYNGITFLIYVITISRKGIFNIKAYK